MNKNTSIMGTAGVMGAALALGGCASPGEPPESELRSAEASIQQAVSSDAREFEPVLLNQAQNKVADAEELIEQEQYQQAERLLEQASVDAQLAGARSSTAKAEAAVEEINRSIESLRQRIETNQ
ncbi:DUF4398 domain-containing protein [Marinobacter lipolyticus]|uniref:DUF4398 domain-containing protein n=1 Tax=Marinobacter lipolyticus TaxID=209639 RepID=UPI001BD1B625|nr:DUF4398 domain-containing protein [Marinobacter lipolyticus]MBS8239485.1 DUF4398 domain-containing protein [Marinobacter lipolyticus]